MSDPDGVTHWLERLRGGDQEALDRVLPLVYDELKAVAGYYMREERGEHTLSATALVHEAYLRMVKQRRIRVEDRSQFLSVAATMMRRVLVDWARAKKREKRGGGRVPVPLEAAENLLSDDEVDEVIALDDALERLAKVNPRGSQVVEQRFFGGLQVEEIAQLQGRSTRTVRRDWVAARAWLRKEVERDLGL